MFRVILLSGFALFLSGCSGFLTNADLNNIYAKGASRQQIAEFHSSQRAIRPLTIRHIPDTRHWSDLGNDRYHIYQAILHSPLANKAKRIKICEVWWRPHGVLGDYYDYVFYDYVERVVGYHRVLASSVVPP